MRPLPAQNRDKTHCLRGHPLSGDNLRISRKGYRICRACHSAAHKQWKADNHAQYRTGTRAYSKRMRSEGKLICGYTKNVLQSTGRERLEQSFQLIRDTGRLTAADAILTSVRRCALMGHYPKIGAAMRKAAAEGKALILPKAPRIIRPSGAANLMDRAAAVVPRHLSKDQRDDVIQEIVFAVVEGRMSAADIEARAKAFVSASYRDDHNKFGPLSLDLPAFREGTTPLVETISKGLWQ